MKDTGSAPACQLINGGYEQTNDVRHYARSFYTGTYAYYTHGLSFADYELTVRIARTTFNSIGVIFALKTTAITIGFQ